MKSIIIDTNALISFVTDRNLEQQEKIAAVFEDASRLKLSILTHQNVITEFVYVMDKLYNVKKNKISEMISDLLQMPGVELSVDFHYKTILELWPKSISDFGDALIAALCKRTKDTSIATFDIKFQKALSELSIPVFDFKEFKSGSNQVMS